MKITIDNEEVLCDKNFTIEEEMLNTSSVILNNVYPATWEQDKDYTSRFYYPKDYSKCKIFNEIVHPTTREDAEGTSFSIEVDTTKQYQVQTLKGQTTQTGTPTPSSPIPINITTGRQVVSTQQGNQLFNKNNPKILNAKYGTTITADNNERMLYIPCKPNTTYTLYHIATTPMRNSIGTTQTLPSISTPIENGVYSSTSPKTITTNANAKYIVWQFYAMNDTTHTLQQVLDSIMINEGATALPYEEYKGIDYVINLGENLYYISNADNTQTWNGVTVISTHTGYSISGTASTTGAYTLVNRYFSLEAGTYSIVLKNPSATRIGLSKTNYSSIIRLTAGTTKGTFTLTETTNVCLTIEISNGAVYDEENEVMVCKGTDVGAFTPYKTPIYLGKIGTYQDYIFRNTTENPLYDSNLEEGQWYIHKEIGRVVLNGSESWRRTGTKTSGNYYFFQDDILSNVKFDGSNRFIGMSNMGITTNAYQEIQGFDTIYHNNQYVRSRFYSDTTKTMSTSAFATWLASNNVEVYYVLNTPTNTLIEDEELINQLNEIEIFTVISEDFYN